MTGQIEQYYAHMEADRNEAEDAYFAARPNQDTKVFRAYFREGFERAYAKLWPLSIVQIDEKRRASEETKAAPSIKIGDSVRVTLSAHSAIPADGWTVYRLPTSERRSYGLKHAESGGDMSIDAEYVVPAENRSAGQ